MFAGQKHRADSDSRGQDVREHNFHPRLWDRVVGRSRGRNRTQPRWFFGRHASRFSAGAKRQQLLHAEHAGHAPGLHRRRGTACGQRHGQRAYKTVACLLLLLAFESCGRREDPQAAFDRDYQTFLRGDLKQSEGEAEQAYRRFLHSRPEWAWKFRILQAEASLWRGLYEQVPELLGSPPAFHNQPELAISTSTLVGVANVHLRKFAEAERNLRDAEQLCSTDTDTRCGEVIQARGLLASQQAQFVRAERFFGQSLSFARGHADRFLESTSLLNLGAMSLAMGHFDEAIDRSQAAYEAARAIDAKIVELVAKGNLGWAYYKLGDSEYALELSAEAEELASQLGDVSDRENELTNIGYVYLDSGKLDLAAHSFQHALSLAEGINAKEDIYNALRVLARLSLQTGDLANANQYAQQALQIARDSGNHVDELYPMLVQGQIAAGRGDAVSAERSFRAVEQDKKCPVFLKWEAQHSLARLYEDQNQSDAADGEYRSALASFEAARDDVRHEDSQLSFLTNASRIYDDYIHFLISRWKPTQSIQVADYSRARTLAEGLGLLSKRSTFTPDPLDAQQAARRAGGAILFYWLGEKQSYLWAITPQKTGLFLLPPASEIDAAVQRYRKALVGPQDVLETANSDGTSLYRILISPAQAVLKKERRVFIIPDDSLNGLNFETLLVPDPKLHYWIEDATIADASSLRLLAASHNSQHDSKTGPGKLLLVGDAVSPNADYADLPKAGVEIKNIEKHFAPAGREVLTRAQATAPAYLGSAPEQFAFIHFVAHGTASRLSPLDSAVILSKASPQEDSFKLYARDRKST